MELYEVKRRTFTYVTTVIDLGYKNQIILDVAPNTITKEKLIEKINRIF